MRAVADGRVRSWQERVGHLGWGHQYTVPVLAAVTGTGVSLTLTHGANARLLIALALFAVVALQAEVQPVRLLVGLAASLPLLGLFRRLVSELIPYTTVDPLVLLVPVALGLLTLRAVRDDTSPRTSLAVAVFWLSAFTVAGSLNPGDSLTAGISGLIFVLGPQLAFWIGRVSSDQTVERVLRMTVLVATLTACYGVLQVLHGFPSWDQTWITEHGYAALNVNGTVRPFASYSAASEFAFMCALAAAACVFGHRFLRAPVLFPALVILLGALLLESVRTAILQLLLAVLVVVGARLRLRPMLTLVLSVGALIAVPLLVAKTAPATSGSGAASTLVQHQVSGLANPLESKDSTADTHLKLIVGGLRSPLQHPLGVGTGAVTSAGEKFGGTSQDTESDLSNVSVALGFPGAAAYIAVLLMGFRRAYRLASERHVLGAIVLAILTATAFQWLNGGQYAVAWLPWLLLGWLDRVTMSAGRNQVAAQRSEA